MAKPKQPDAFVAPAYDLEHAIAVAHLVRVSGLPNGTLAEIVAATGYPGHIGSLTNMVNSARLYGLVRVTFDPAVRANRIAVTPLADDLLPPTATEKAPDDAD